MLNVNKAWGRVTKLAAPISSTDTTIKLPAGAGQMFVPLTSGEWFDLTLSNGEMREVVKVTAVNGDVLTVQRGQDGTVAQTWANGQCIKHEWNPRQLCEFNKMCLGGGPQQIIEPQTVCTACPVCFTIDNQGRITTVNGGNGTC
jgi:hypothetical protein